MAHANDQSQIIEDYVPPRVESLGTFTELTQMRSTPRTADNGTLLGTQ